MAAVDHLDRQADRGRVESLQADCTRLFLCTVMIKTYMLNKLEQDKVRGHLVRVSLGIVLFNIKLVTIYWG